MMSRFPLCGLALLLFSCAGLAQQSIAPGDCPSYGILAPTITYQQTCEILPLLGPDQLAPASVPQFDPALGQLQSVNIGIFVEEAFGTADFNYLGYPSDCNLTPFFDDCASAGVMGAFSAAISLGNPLTFNFGGSFFGQGTYCCEIGPASLAWDDPYFGAGNGPDVAMQGYNFAGAQLAPFIGTGSLVFTASGTASDDVYLGEGAPTTATVDGIEADISVNYFYTPTPEPSFFVVIALVLGCLAARKFRVQRA